MLHQRASTFDPSLPVPSTARPFDANKYLTRARELGIMVFPSIFSSGTCALGLCAYPGYSFSIGNERLAEEFGAELRASSDGTAAIFEALCEDFGLDPADAAFNDKVNAICRARSEASNDGDTRLIELCTRAKRALEKDLEATNLLCDFEEKFEKIQPEKPTYTSALGAVVREHDDARSMREALADGMAEWSRTAVKNYRARIANVVAYEKERDRVSREIGLTKAKAAASSAGYRVLALITDVAELPATTLLGMAHKAALLPLWDKAGYGLSCSDGEALAYSIAEDARMLGTGGPVGGRSRTSRNSQKPCAQAH